MEPIESDSSLVVYIFPSFCAAHAKRRTEPGGSDAALHHVLVVYECIVIQESLNLKI